MSDDDPGLVVVGTYPPIPLPAAAATVAAVRRGWAEGFDPTVVSPRPSAADLSVPVAGPLAGRRLGQIARATAARRIVLVAEPGCPVPDGRPAVQWLTVWSVRRGLRRFEDVTVVRVGDLGLSTRLASWLFAAADRVLDAPGSPATGALPGGGAGVTPLGPDELAPDELPRVLAARVARRVHDRLPEPVASAATRLLRAVRNRR